VSPPSPEASGLRVGYVLKMYPRLSETFILDEILGLEEAGAAVSVYSLRPPTEGRFHPDVSRVHGDVHYLPDFASSSALQAFRTLRDLGPGSEAALDRALRFLDRLAAKQPSLLVQGLELASAARRDGVEHLHAHFMTVAAQTAYLAHLFTGLPFTVTAHAKDVYRRTVDREVFREIAEAAAGIVTVCEYNRRYILDRLLEGNAARVVRIYNGIPLDAVPAGPRSREGHLILGVGRLVEKKGYDVLLEACRILVDRGIHLRCLVIGDGDQREPLLNLRGRLGLEGVVEFPGSMPRNRILEWMQRARVLVAPCVTGEDGNRDALPTVALEALASGLPVVSTPVGGIPEIVEHGVEGLLVPERDPRALADALRALLSDEVMWTRLSRAARAKAALRFDRRKNLPELISLFRGAAAASAGKARAAR
jgi:colanic acid/amylovoran biosynthesis glycosyltransferase